MAISGTNQVEIRSKSGPNWVRAEGFRGVGGQRGSEGSGGRPNSTKTGRITETSLKKCHCRQFGLQSYEFQHVGVSTLPFFSLQRGALVCSFRCFRGRGAENTAQKYRQSGSESYDLQQFGESRLHFFVSLLSARQGKTLKDNWCHVHPQEHLADQAVKLGVKSQGVIPMKQGVGGRRLATDRAPNYH